MAAGKNGTKYYERAQGKSTERFASLNIYSKQGCCLM
jgi:hypothetical protein